MKILFLAWQDPQSRTWFPVGRLSYDAKIYRFVYTRGALEAQQQAGFHPLRTFPELEEVYESDTLFPLFANRLLGKSRPDYREFVSWLNLSQNEDDPLVLLARSGGRRVTDELEVFPAPERDESGNYHIHFFADGLRHLPPASMERISVLIPGEQLLLLHDYQNPRDHLALALRTGDPDPFLVGYCPRYLLSDTLELLQEKPESVNIAVERVNFSPAPLQLRLLCNMTAHWPQGFVPYSSHAYQPIAVGNDTLVETWLPGLNAGL